MPTEPFYRISVCVPVDIGLAKKVIRDLIKVSQGHPVNGPDITGNFAVRNTRAIALDKMRQLVADGVQRGNGVQSKEWRLGPTFRDPLDRSSLLYHSAHHLFLVELRKEGVNVSDACLEAIAKRLFRGPCKGNWHDSAWRHLAFDPVGQKQFNSASGFVGILTAIQVGDSVDSRPTGEGSITP